MKNYQKPILSAQFEKSSNIKEAEYDPFMKVLTVKFATGGEYDYLDVEKSLFDSLKKASSAGRFFHTKIRGKYEFFKKRGDQKKEALSPEVEPQSNKDTE